MIRSVSLFEEESASPTHSKLVSIQYLRAIAALTVLVTHALQWPLSGENNVLISTGRFGVEIFFVLSGFIIAVIAGDGRFAPIAFARKRIQRIVPMYWLATFMVFGLAIAMPASFRTTVPNVEGFLKSLLFIPSDVPKAPLLMLGWTLNFEVFFYLAFGSLFFVKAAVRALSLATLFILLIMLGRLTQNLSYLQEIYTSLSLLGFILGVGIGHLYQSGALQRLSRVTLFGLTALGFLALLTFYFAALALDPERNIVLFHISMSVAATALVAVAIRMEINGRLPVIPALRFLGDASYSLYLFHLFAVGAVWTIASKLFGKVGWLGYASLSVLAISAGMIAGIFMYWMLERPQLLQKREQRSSPAQASLS